MARARLVRPMALAGLIGLSTAIAACAGASGPAASGAQTQNATAERKRITVAINGDARTVIYRIAQATAGATPGVEAVEELVNAGLANVSSQGFRPLLAESIPTLDNGLWELLPDGRMVLRWTIKEGAEWHDGTPLTTADLLFTAAVSQNQADPIFYDSLYDFIDSVQAVDDRRVQVRWRRPYVDAQRLFTRARELAPILPRHLLEQSYAADPLNFSNLAYFSSEYVGMGPFKMLTWEPDTRTVLQANDRYVLGRPKLDEVEVRFIPDFNVMWASILSGDVELTMGRGFPLNQALDLSNRWQDGKAYVPLKGWNALYPQFIDPTPAVVTDLQFRRALLMAIDRQQISDTVGVGLLPVAHAYLSPNHPDYPTIEPSIVRYDFDLRRAAQMLAELGYRRGDDGEFRDGSGKQLTVQVQTGEAENAVNRMAEPVAAAWKAFGVDVGINLVPTQRLRDLEYRATFQSFQIQRRDNDLGEWRMFRSNAVALPSNGFVGTNASRYANPQWDALIDQYDLGVREPDRIAALSEIVHFLSDQLPMMGLIYSSEPVAASNRIVNFDPEKYVKATVAWNAEQWDMTG